MKRNQKAWLLTWEWMDDHAAVEDRIAAILRPRLSQQIVGEIVETIYGIHVYSPVELAIWSKRPKENPHRAIWHNIHCCCGHNPSLHANHIDDLTVTEDQDSGLETISWVFPPVYRLNHPTGEKELVCSELPKSVTRNLTGPLSDREIGRYR